MLGGLSTAAQPLQGTTAPPDSSAIGYQSAARCHGYGAVRPISDAQIRMRLVLEFRTTSPSARRYYSAGRQTLSNHWKVVIIGGGFGGLTASQNLKLDLVDVTQINRRKYHLFQPLLYQVANGSLELGEIAAPLRGVLSRQRNTRVSLDNVVNVDPNAEHVLLENGAIPCAEAAANFGGSTRGESATVGCSLILAGDPVFLHA